MACFERQSYHCPFLFKIVFPKGLGFFSIWIYTFEHSIIILKQSFNHVQLFLLRFQVSITKWPDIPRSLPWGRRMDKSLWTHASIPLNSAERQNQENRYSIYKGQRFKTNHQNQNNELSLEWSGEQAQVHKQRASEMNWKWEDMPDSFLCTAGYVPVSRTI